MIFDEQEVRKAVAILKPNNELFEIRIIENSRTNYSGYFVNADNLINALKKLRSAGNVYITLNNINDACYDRVQKDKFVKNPKATTSDNDVNNYEWLMIDLDPKRPTDTSSTDEQIEKAKKMGNKIYGFLNQLGFEKPITAYSGNGVHLLYGIDMDTSTDNVNLLKMALQL